MIMSKLSTYCKNLNSSSLLEPEPEYEQHIRIKNLNLSSILRHEPECEQHTHITFYSNLFNQFYLTKQFNDFIYFYDYLLFTDDLFLTTDYLTLFNLFNQSYFDSSYLTNYLKPLFNQHLDYTPSAPQAIVGDFSTFTTNKYDSLRDASVITLRMLSKNNILRGIPNMGFDEVLERNTLNNLLTPKAPETIKLAQDKTLSQIKKKKAKQGFKIRIESTVKHPQNMSPTLMYQFGDTAAAVLFRYKKKCRHNLRFNVATLQYTSAKIPNYWIPSCVDHSGISLKGPTADLRCPHCNQDKLFVQSHLCRGSTQMICGHCKLSLYQLFTGALTIEAPPYIRKPVHQQMVIPQTFIPSGKWGELFACEATTPSTVSNNPLEGEVDRERKVSDDLAYLRTRFPKGLPFISEIVRALNEFSPIPLDLSEKIAYEFYDQRLAVENFIHKHKPRRCYVCDLQQHIPWDLLKVSECICNKTFNLVVTKQFTCSSQEPCRIHYFLNLDVNPRYLNLDLCPEIAKSNVVFTHKPLRGEKNSGMDTITSFFSAIKEHIGGALKHITAYFESLFASYIKHGVTAFGAYVLRSVALHFNTDEETLRLMSEGMKKFSIAFQALMEAIICAPALVLAYEYTPTRIWLGQLLEQFKLRLPKDAWGEHYWNKISAHINMINLAANVMAREEHAPLRAALRGIRNADDPNRFSWIFTAFGFPMKFINRYFKPMLTMFNQLCSARKNLADLLDVFKQYLPDCILSLTSLISPKTAYKKLVETEYYKNLLFDITRLNAYAEQGEAQLYEEAKEKVENGMDKFSEEIRTHNLHLDPHILNSYTKLRKLADTHLKGVKNIDHPVVVVLSGLPGTCKSTLWPVLLMKCFPGKTYEDIFNLSKFDTCGDDFMSGLRGGSIANKRRDLIYVMDDGFQSVKEQDVMKIIQMTSPGSYFPNMPDVESKGMNWKPKFIVICTNNPEILPKSIFCEKALKRRLHTIFEFSKIKSDKPPGDNYENIQITFKKDVLHLTNCLPNDQVVSKNGQPNGLKVTIQEAQDLVFRAQKQIDGNLAKGSRFANQFMYPAETPKCGQPSNSGHVYEQKTTTSYFVAVSEEVRGFMRTCYNVELLETEPAILELAKHNGQVKKLLDKPEIIRSILELEKERKFVQMASGFEAFRRIDPSEFKNLTRSEFQQRIRAYLEMRTLDSFDRLKLNEMQLLYAKQFDTIGDCFDIPEETDDNIKIILNYLGKAAWAIFTTVAVYGIAKGISTGKLKDVYNKKCQEIADRKGYHREDDQWVKNSGEGHVRARKANVYMPARRNEGQADQLLDRFYRSLVKVRRQDGMCLHGFIVSGTDLLVNEHLFHSGKSVLKWYEDLITINYWNTHDMSSYSFYPDENSMVQVAPDIVLYRLNTKTSHFPVMKDNTSHFIDSNIELVERRAISLSLANNKQMITHTTIEFDMAELEYEVSKTEEPEMVHFRNAICCNHSGKPGDCGSVLVYDDHGIDNGKILGIHVASLLKNTKSMFIPITRRIILESIDILNERFGVSPSRATRNAKYFVEGVEPTYPIEGRTIPICSMKKPIYIPNKTTLKESVVHGTFGESKVRPATMQFADVPKGIAKYSDNFVVFDETLLQQAADSIVTDLEKVRPRFPRRILTEHEAINGISTSDNIKSMNLNTSAGFPYSGENVSSKKDLLTGEINNLKIKDKYLSDWHWYQNTIKAGQITDFAYTLLLKDEKRPIQADGSVKTTRTFASSGMWSNLMTRMYTQAFVDHMVNLRGRCFSAVGINKITEWDFMIRRLLQVGRHHAFDGDYSKWDGMCSKQCMLMIPYIMNKWYKDEHSLVRTTLMQETANSLQIAKNIVFQTNGGMPSGDALTALGNTIVNELYIRVGWLTLAPSVYCDISLYKKYVRTIILGDDNVIVVDPLVSSFFNGNSFKDFTAQHGLTYTSAEKTQDFEFKSVLDARFLKNTTGVKHGRYVPLMEKASIIETTNWIRTGKYMETETLATQENVNNSLRDMYFYTKEEFENFRESILEVRPDLDLLTYEYLDQCFLSDSYPDPNNHFGFGGLAGNLCPDKNFKEKLQAMKNSKQETTQDKQVDNTMPELEYSSVLQTDMNTIIDKTTTNTTNNQGAQGTFDDAVKKDISGHGITIEETKDFQVADTTVDAVVSNQIPENVNPDISWSMRAMGDRNHFVGAYTWNTTDQINHQLAILDIPVDTFISQNLQWLISNNTEFHFTRAFMFIEVVGHRFSSGRAVAAFIPTGVNRDDFNDDYSVARLIQIGGVQIDPSTSNTVILEIPWIYYQNYVNLVKERKEAIGQFSMKVLSPLTVAEDSPTSVDFRIYVRYENPQFKMIRSKPGSLFGIKNCGSHWHLKERLESILEYLSHENPWPLVVQQLPHLIRDIKLATTEELMTLGPISTKVIAACLTLVRVEEDDLREVDEAMENLKITHPLQGERNSGVDMEALDKELDAKNWPDPIDQLTDTEDECEEGQTKPWSGVKNIAVGAGMIGAAAIGAVATIASKLIPSRPKKDPEGRSMDALSVGQLPMAFNNKYMEYLNPSQYLSFIDPMRHKPGAETYVYSQQKGTTDNQLTKSYLLRRKKSILKSNLVYFTSQTKGDIIYQWRSGPMSTAATDTFDGNLPITDYLASYHKFWRGGLVYGLDIVNNAFYTGRITVTFHYGVDGVDADINQANNDYSYTFQIQDNSSWFVFSIPYFGTSPWRQVANGTKFVDGHNDDINEGFNFMNYFNGTVTISVADPLKAPLGLTQSVRMNLYVWGDEDFDLYFPTTNNRSLIPIYPEQTIPSRLEPIKDTDEVVNSLTGSRYVKITDPVDIPSRKLRGVKNSGSNISSEGRVDVNTPLSQIKVQRLSGNNVTFTSDTKAPHFEEHVEDFAEYFKRYHPIQNKLISVPSSYQMDLYPFAVRGFMRNGIGRILTGFRYFRGDLRFKERIFPTEGGSFELPGKYDIFIGTDFSEVIDPGPTEIQNMNSLFPNITSMEHTSAQMPWTYANENQTAEYKVNFQNQHQSVMLPQNDKIHADISKYLHFSTIRWVQGRGAFNSSSQFEVQRFVAFGDSTEAWGFLGFPAVKLAPIYPDNY